MIRWVESPSSCLSTVARSDFTSGAVRGSRRPCRRRPGSLTNPLLIALIGPADAHLIGDDELDPHAVSLEDGGPSVLRIPDVNELITVQHVAEPERLSVHKGEAAADPFGRRRHDVLLGERRG